MHKIWHMLSVWRFRFRDWYNHDRYTSISVCVPAPQSIADAPTLMVTLSTGPRCRLRFRVRDLEAWDSLWQIPQDSRERLTAALREAKAQHAELIEEQRLLDLRRQGVGLARTDTGQVVSEAERIVQEVNHARN